MLLFLSKIEFYQSDYRKLKPNLSSGDWKIRGPQNSFDFLEYGVIFCP